MFSINYYYYYYYYLVYQGVFGHLRQFPIISVRRFANATEDSRRFPKTNEGVRPLPQMSEEPSKHLTVFSLETVNIKKLANLTENTKNYGQITPNIKPHSDPHGRF